MDEGGNLSSIERRRESAAASVESVGRSLVSVSDDLKGSSTKGPGAIHQ